MRWEALKSTPKQRSHSMLNIRNNGHTDTALISVDYWDFRKALAHAAAADSSDDKPRHSPTPPA